LSKERKKSNEGLKSFPELPEGEAAAFLFFAAPDSLRRPSLFFAIAAGLGFLFFRDAVDKPSWVSQV